MALPYSLFSSSASNYDPSEFVKQILKHSDLPAPLLLVDDIHGYEWSFETKYYTATICLCTTGKRTIGDQDFADNLQAFIHFFDPNEPESFELTKAWLPYLEHIEPSIQILACHTSRQTDATNRKTVLEWCLTHGFELVELSPEEEDKDGDDESEDDFLETTGIARIIQALHAHTWPNLELKENPSIQSPYVRQLMKEQHLLNLEEAAAVDEKNQDEETLHAPSNPEDRLAGSAVSPETNTPANANRVGNSKLCEGLKEGDKRSSKDNTDADFDVGGVDWTALMGADNPNAEDLGLGDEELGVEEFEKLFESLKIMKDKAENLPPDERKKYAEQVAVSFWKAIGGDGEEIAGIGEESD